MKWTVRSPVTAWASDAAHCSTARDGWWPRRDAGPASPAIDVERDVTQDLAATPPLDAQEVRERMSGNLCRCSAYPHIVDAILEAGQGT